MSQLHVDPKEIRRLWILKLIVENGTIKRAAVAANLTSSAVSQALSGLEEDLKRRLLIRQGDKFVPTPYCQGLLNAATPALDALESLQSYISPKQDAIPKLSSLTIGTTQSIAIDVLPGLTERLRDKCPGIRIHLKVGRSAALCASVRKGELSIALVADNDNMEGLSVVPVATERMGFYCSSRPEIAKHGWALVERLGVGAFPPDQDGYAPYFRKLFKIFGPNWRPSLLSESYEALRVLASNGSMVCVLSTRVAALQNGDLIELDPPQAKSSSKTAGAYCISLVSDRSMEPALTEFLAKELQIILQATKFS